MAKDKFYRIAYRWDEKESVYNERWFIESDYLTEFEDAKKLMFDVVSNIFENAKTNEKARTEIYRCRLEEIEGVFSTVIIEIHCKI